jgi:hypothetical protein
MCPLTSTQGERLCPPLFEHLGVVERIVDDIAIFVGQIVIFPKWRGRPCSSRSLVSKYAVISCFGFLVEIGQNLSVSSFW